MGGHKIAMSDFQWWRKEVIRKDYMDRWCLLALPRGIRVYLHRYHGSDWSHDHHDHPKAFLCIGLHGGYIDEERVGGIPRHSLKRRRYVAPFMRRFDKYYAHRLRVSRRSGCWTLVFTGVEQRKWGWYDDKKFIWIPYDRYIEERLGPDFLSERGKHKS